MGNKTSSIENVRSLELGKISYYYPDNRFKSSKYTIWNFIPRNLFKQFKRFANLYFLIMSFVTAVIDSPVTPWASFTPLIIVVSTSAIKQAYEDWLRHKADKITNSKQVTVIRNGIRMKITSKNVRVGDLIEVFNDDDVPCDILILWTSRPDAKCFVMTSNLDGESNLKKLESPLNNYFPRKEIFITKGEVKYDLPTADLYSFNGEIQIELEGSDPVLRQIPDCALMQSDKGQIIYRNCLSSSNLLLRGARLKNTSSVIGCAVYTGPDTKLALNSRKISQKSAKSERAINYFLGFFFFLLVLEVLISVIMDFYEAKYGLESSYLGKWPNFKFVNILNEFFSFIVLYYYIIPISLYVTIELQRFLGSHYFNWDEEMCYNDLEPSANTSDINEDLGQVNYLFSDKTGTLTENKMTFRQFSVDGIRYEESEGVLYENIEADIPRSPIETWPSDVKNLFLAMVLCHTVQCSTSIEENSEKKSRGEKLLYEASSPDEKALLEACERCGVVYLGEEAGVMTIKFHNDVVKYRKLRLAEFSSETKRMAILVTDEKGSGYIFCKGADCALIPLITEGNIDGDSENLKFYSMKGLRTLIYSWKKLDGSQLNEAMDTEELCVTGLTLLGATAVEDHLQPLVSETLSALLEAGIKVWMLTGDKVETALAIGLSCGLTKSGLLQLLFVGHSPNPGVLDYLKMLRDQVQDPGVKYNLVIDGKSQNSAANDIESLSILIDIALRADSVICCRLAPKQKAQMVRLVKSSKSQPLTAAIGDGANDVAMILEAHVGLGILGKEGRQAVNNADFSIPVFFALKRTLFVHGHWYYMRLATLVQYFFYKNIVFITPQVFFALHNGVSPQPLFNSVFLLLYNTLFTSLPILVYSLLEQDYPAERLMTQPKLYSMQKNNALLKWSIFFRWVACGVWHSVVVYFVPWALIMKNASLLSFGQPVDLICFGTIVIHLSIIVVNFKLLLHSQYWTWYFTGSIAISTIGFILFTFIYNTLDMFSGSLYDAYTKLVTSLFFWILTVLATVAALLPDVVYRVVFTMFPDITNHISWPTCNWKKKGWYNLRGNRVI